MGLRKRATGVMGAAACLVMVMSTTGTAEAAPAPVIDFRKIVNKASGKCLEVENSWTHNGAPVQQWDCNGQAGATWYPSRVANNLYLIKNSKSGKCLEFENSSPADGTRAQLWDCKGQDGSLWAFFRQSDGRYEIVSWASNSCLEIENSSTANGANAQEWTCKGQPGSRWTLLYDV